MASALPPVEATGRRFEVELKPPPGTGAGGGGGEIPGAGGARGPSGAFGAAGVIWVVLSRYRGLVPLMLAVVTAEQALRVGIGQFKPLVTAHTPPGALSKVVLPASAVALAMSLNQHEQAH